MNEKRDIRELPVRMANALIMAKQGFTKIDEKRIAMAAVARMDDATFDKRTQRYIVELTIKELMQVYPALSTENNVYNDVKAALKSLRRCEWRIDRKLDDGTTDVYEGVWFTTTRYNDKRGSFQLRFNPDVTPLVRELADQYTTYAIAMTSNLRTLKAWRLMELLMQRKNDQERWLTTEQLFEALDAAPSQRRNWAEFKRTILDPAIKELHDLEGWQVVATPKKEGLRLKNIHFEFSHHKATARNGKARTRAKPAQPNINTKAEIAAMKHALKKEH